MSIHALISLHVCSTEKAIKRVSLHNYLFSGYIIEKPLCLSHRTEQMETGLSLRFLQQKRLNTKESRLDQLLKIIRIKWEVLNNIFLGIQRTCVVVRQIRVILDLVIEILFVDGLQEHAHADAREFHEFGVVAVSRVRSEHDNVGLWIIALNQE